MIDNTSIEQLKSRIEIVEVISHYIEVKKFGANFKANCPFHGEKTPSFVISPQKGIYHCFGCGVGGDGIKFVQELEKVTYPEALEKIASILNFTLQKSEKFESNNESKMVMEAISHWYIKNLAQNKIAKEYLGKRKISTSSIEKFGVGFVDKSYDVIDFLHTNKLNFFKAQEAGLIDKNESNKWYARLVERIIFPIHSASGAIVGFGGRTITNHPAKYINSPQTKFFNKSQLLYGYHLAKESIMKSKKLIVCEGYLDVIMLHQGGFPQAVATLGTALTEQHLPLLRRGEPHIVLAYDGDKAGVNAAIKASILLSQHSFEGSVVLFPDNFDPADMVANGKEQELATLFRSGKGLIEFVLEKSISAFDLGSVTQKELAFHETKKYLDALSGVAKESYIDFASSLLGIPKTLFKEQNMQKVQEKMNIKTRDMAKLSTLKTMLEDSSLLASVIHHLDIEMFGEYFKVYELILKQELSHPYLIKLSLDESIKLLNKEEFKQSIINMLIVKYELKLKKMSIDREMQYDEKSFWIRKIKLDILPRLKKGIFE